MANAASTDPSPQIRLYLDLPFKAGLLIEPSPAQCHYLLTVMRQPPGGTVALFNGTDGEWRATIEPAGRRSCRLALQDQIRPQRPEPGPTLLFAPLKRMRQEMLVEKATELGVSRLQPVFCLRSVVDRVSSARLFGIAAEAAEQCGRLTVPAIDAPLPLGECLEGRAEGRPLYLGDETRT
ncbi:MAG: RsmE family RNA methyltransferase, partial [Geminicoccaceae bacterium]